MWLGGTILLHRRTVHTCQYRAYPLPRDYFTELFQINIYVYTLSLGYVTSLSYSVRSHFRNMGRSFYRQGSCASCSTPNCLPVSWSFILNIIPTAYRWICVICVFRCFRTVAESTCLLRYICLPACMSAVSHQMDFSHIYNGGLLWNSVNKIKLWLTSGTFFEDLSTFYCYRRYWITVQAPSSNGMVSCC